jgi:hypothetical protein
MKNKLYLIKSFLSGMLIFVWIFSGWPKVFNNPYLPPKIQKAQAATETIRPTDAYVFEGWTTPSYGYDGNTSTSASFDTLNKQPSISFGGNNATEATNSWQSKTNTWSAATVYFTFSKTAGSNDTVWVTIYDGPSDTTKHTVIASTTGAVTKQEFSQTLNSSDWGGAGFPNIANLRVRVNGSKSGGPDGAVSYMYDVRIDGTYTANTSPSVVLNTADTSDFGTDTTPALEFTGTDADSDDIRYNIVIDDSSDCLTPILNKVSGTDAGFVNTISGGDTDPFNSGEKASYTVQAGDELSTGTYYWRVRGIDPSGTNTYGSWSSIRSFSVTAPVISITITANGTIDYGTVSTSQDTTSNGINQTIQVQNNGTVVEDFDIRGQNSTNWTLAASAGDATYKHEWCTQTCDSTPTWNTLTTTYDSNYLASSVAVDDTVDFDLKITIPTSNAGASQQNVDVFIRATAN